MPAPTAMVVIDYQNIHLTARDLFAPKGTPAHDVLIHPLRFAEQVIAARQARIAVQALAGKATGSSAQPELVAVEVHRGQPSNRKQSRLYNYSLAQRSEWTRDRRVEVHYRPLAYRMEYGVEVVQEKGVDVRVALSIVKAAAEHRADLIILASHDTDLEPALELAPDFGDATIETAGWVGGRVLLRSRGVRHTALDGAGMVRSRDHKKY